jgi:hypothetical protein
MKDLSKKISLWITAAIVLTIGILCIVAGAAAGDKAGADAYKGITMVLGIVSLVIASLALLFALINSIVNKKGFAAEGLGAAMLLSIGIFFIVRETTASNLIALVLDFIPFLLIVAGAIILVDAILSIVFGIIKKELKNEIAGIVVEIVVALVAIILGSLCLIKKDNGDTIINMNARFIILGIILCLYSVYILLLSFFKPVAVVAIVASKDDTKKDAVDADVEEVKADDTEKANE